jgi:uncharacterized cupredoxin-like copper-binding protein
MDLDAANDALMMAEAQLAVDQQAAMEAAEDVAEATALVAGATADVIQAQADVTAAEMDLADAQMILDETQMVVDAAQAVVDAIVAEIEGTEEFVANLSDEEVFGFNRSFNNAIQTDLLPLDIDLDLLDQLALDGLTNREIQLATNGFESEARFMRIADRFDAKAAASGMDHFAAKADRARAKGTAQKEKFLAKVGVEEAVAEAASEAAKDRGKRAGKPSRD